MNYVVSRIEINPYQLQTCGSYCCFAWSFDMNFKNLISEYILENLFLKVSRGYVFNYLDSMINLGLANLQGHPALSVFFNLDILGTNNAATMLYLGSN